MTRISFRFNRPAWLAVLGFALCVLSSAGTEADTWESLSQGLSPETPPQLKADSTPSEQLAYALSLMTRQPMTQENITQAELICGKLAGEKEPTQIAMVAGYLYARIAHVHRIPTDLDAASARYEVIWEAYPQKIPGQQSLVKQATIELYRDKSRFQEHFYHYADAVTRFTSAEAKRDMHLVLADAAQRFGLYDATVLVQLKAALAASPPQPALKADLLIRIAELARLTGNRTEAASRYQQFIDEFPRDGRRTLARERLQMLDASIKAATSPNDHVKESSARTGI